MGRFIFWLLLALGLVLWWRSRSARRASPAQTQAVPQAMVACLRCGVHLPRADAVVDARGRSFCGVDHREAHAAAEAQAGR